MKTNFLLAAIFTTLFCVPAYVKAQSVLVKKLKPVKIDTAKIIKPDTVYTITGDQNINTLYVLMQQGYAAIKDSPHFSDDQRKQFVGDAQKLFNILNPQVQKWHPQIKKPVIK